MNALIILFLTGLMCLPLGRVQAQRIRIFSASDSLPVAAAHVMMRSAANDRPVVMLSDTSGRVDLSRRAADEPLEIKISCLGFRSLTDTLYGQRSRTYYLKPAEVSINEVVVTGEYVPGNPDNAIHTIRVIDEKKINLMAAQSLADVLRNELNIRLGQDNILGSSMSIQGISGENVKILIDGVPVIGRLNGNIDIAQINLNNVARIEIVEGPLAVNYGTNALAGTINIITKKQQRDRWHISNTDYYESNGTYNLSGKLGYSDNKNTVQLTVGRHFFDGWNEGDRAFLYRRSFLADDGRVQQWKPKEQYFGGLLYARRIGDFQFRLNIDVFDEDIYNRGLPREPYGLSAFDDVYHTFRNSNGLFVDGRLSEGLRMELVAGHNNFKRVKNTFFKDLTTLEQRLSSGEGDQDTSIFRSFMSRGRIVSDFDSSPLNFEVGYDLNYEDSRSRQISEGQRAMGDYALFGTVLYRPVTRLALKPGLRVAYNSVYRAPVIPSLNLKYDIPIGADLLAQRLTLRASYARGFRAPSLKELYFSFVDINHNIHGNEDLKAEYSHNFIVNASWKRVANQSIVKLSWNNFYNKISNRIVLAETMAGAMSYTYANLGDFQTFGSSLRFEWAVNHFKIALSGGFVSYSNPISDAMPDVDPFSYTPEVTSTFLYEWKKPRLSVALLYKYTGAMPGYAVDPDGNVKQHVLEDYQMVDASVTKAFAAGRYELAIGAKNILNVTSINGGSSGAGGHPHSSGSFTVPVSMGRTYFVRLALNLNYQ